MEEDDPRTYLQAAEEYVSKMYAGAKVALKPIVSGSLVAVWGEEGNGMGCGGCCGVVGP